MGMPRGGFNPNQMLKQLQKMQREMEDTQAQLAVTTPPPAVPSTTSSASWAWVSSISRCIFLSLIHI